MKNSRRERQKKDLVLLHKIRAGDTQALEKLLDRYLPQLIGFFRYLRAPESIIEDLAQETFVKLIQKVDTYDETKVFSSWLMTIARNHYFDVCRRENRKKNLQTEVQPEYVPTPEEQVVERHSATDLLRTLRPAEKFLVELRVFQGMSFAEISEITGDNEVTLRSRFFRLMGRLRLVTEKKAP